MKAKVAFGTVFLLFSVCSYAQEVKRWTYDDGVVTLYSGTTRRFTVDTPIDSGICSTLIPRDALENELKQNGITSVKRTRTIKAALPGCLTVDRETVTRNAHESLTFHFTAGQRTPNSSVEFHFPRAMRINFDKALINIIGRGAVPLKSLPDQYMGRTGQNYPYDQVGNYNIRRTNRGTVLILSGLDLRPQNGPDISLTLDDVVMKGASDVEISVRYTVTQPEPLNSPVIRLRIKTASGITDLKKERISSFSGDLSRFGKSVTLRSIFLDTLSGLALQASTDDGSSWELWDDWHMDNPGSIVVDGLNGGTLYTFRIIKRTGHKQQYSNEVKHYCGVMTATDFGISPDGSDCTDKLNELLKDLSSYGGGILLFPAGEYAVRTVHLQNDVWLYVEKGAVIKGLPGADAPETTWFSDRDYRSGLSPTDSKPYRDPENYMTKQDVGHTYFHNAMFFAERLENIKILGTGRISGGGALVTSDKVMNNPPEKRADKMFSFKLCKGIEIGGVRNGHDLWYDLSRNEPYYICENGRNYSTDNMLHIDQGGHFALLATGSDVMDVHDICFGENDSSNARDIFDFMECSTISVRNIYSKLSSDDIVKLGSDCSLGFTRKASGFFIRNIIGDTNCNLFQIGSETADDIEDVYVDNICVLGANKAGFSISTNDGAHIRRVFLNSGKTGPLHSRSVMLRTSTPFFLSISNRGRTLGADVERICFQENRTLRDELLVTNASIGKIEDVHITHIDVSEIYGGSAYKSKLWNDYDGTQYKATPIFAGYRLPEFDKDGDKIGITLPDGRNTAYLEKLSIEDVSITVKGGGSPEDRNTCPPELGVGRYNVKDFMTQPAYGLWFRHVKGLTIKDCRIRSETYDARWPIVFDDVTGVILSGITVEDEPVRQDMIGIK